ncbi:receptor-like protein EIX2 [Pistacia vera]|uniref:receptor-like protein EIX2 n=1 Tax=Pistacia vera TaxID=55513 RepID=UPI0012634765|nr:receptor-like protein EIX2 [Pistacia vera]
MGPPLGKNPGSATAPQYRSMLGGKVNPSLLDLKHLRLLDLSDNNFDGQIPKFLCYMHNLRHLDLSLNSFQGIIPHQLGNVSNLQYLALRGRWNPKINGTTLQLKVNHSLTLSFVNLSQPISDVLDIFSRCVSDILESLGLDESQVFGQFTNRLGRFKKLVYLGLYNNSILGSIPSSLGELSSLEIVYIGYNKLNGTVFEMHFSNLTRLVEFFASGNSLVFQVSPHWVPPFKLETLGLRSCHLGPQFQLWLRSQKHLGYLDISDSRIKDAIPTFLFKNPFLLVNLSHNQLYGQIPNLTESTQLEVLDLNSNRLSGALPLLPFKLYLLDLSNNALSGSIFHFLCHKMNESTRMMQILILNNNFLSEVIPNCWMNLKGLKVLNLGNNRFTSKLPASIGTLSSPEWLNLRKNHFSGTILVSLKNCTQMVSLDLGENEFVGNLKVWVRERFSRMKILNLRSNKFSSHLPKELCNLRSLQILDLADNNFFGTIPRCINNFSAMMKISSNEESDMNYQSSRDVFSTYLESELLVKKGHMVEYNTILKFVRGIDLSKNNFFRQIPMEVTNLSELQSLNLSHNGFTGRIPENIGAMRSLESIDFSRNQLSGEIPQSISSLTFLSDLNLSNNNLIGRIPSSTQLSGFEASCFTGNQLCGPPLPNNCTVPTPTINSQSRGKKDGNEDEVNWFFVSMALGFIVGF